MAIGISEEMKGDVAVLTISGRTLMSGPDVVELHEHVKRLVEDGKAKFVVDLTKVRWAGSALLGVLVACLTTARNAEGELKISGLSEKMRSLFLVTELNRLFETYPTPDEAIETMK
ncbi:MAG: STAS domain-containing protein [Candidatus Latescibacteria bacterium]|jgi:anti-sigma B factor antagonist|nr:STAS domain-containing protein [Candidatus Latescibacterota bacterium]